MVWPAQLIGGFGGLSTLPNWPHLVLGVGGGGCPESARHCDMLSTLSIWPHLVWEWGGSLPGLDRAHDFHVSSFRLLCCGANTLCLLAGFPGAKQRHATPAEVEHLHTHKAIKLRAPNTSVVSLHLLAYAVGRLTGKSHLVPSILELATAASHNPGTPLQQADTPSPAAHTAPAAAHPLVLPKCTVDFNTFPFHYSLGQRFQAEPGLHREVKKFSSWLSIPIMLSRPCKSSASRTVDNILKNVFLYLGFLALHFKLVSFSLALFLDTEKFSHFIAFLLAKGNQKAMLSQLLSNARKVCLFLRRDTRGGAPAPDLVASVNQVETWLLRLSKQITTVLQKPKPDVAELERDNKWLPADELVLLLDKFRLDALSKLPTDRNEVLSVYVARLVHDAALSSTLFGSIPPARLSCIRTLQCPGSRRCLHRDCMNTLANAQCKGNCLEFRGPDMYMVLSHHKNKAKWDGAVIQFKVPAMLRDLLLVHLMRCHPVLSPGSVFVFSDLKGRAFLEASQLSLYWEQLLRNCGATAVFPPSM